MVSAASGRDNARARLRAASRCSSSSSSVRDGLNHIGGPTERDEPDAFTPHDLDVAALLPGRRAGDHKRFAERHRFEHRSRPGLGDDDIGGRHQRAHPVGEPEGAQALAAVSQRACFDHRVVSLSGAVGLFQLMPAITEAMQIKLSVESEDSLKEPSLNARLGAAYLGRLLRQFNRNPALALAAYNAGPGSVHKWLKQDPAARLDLFVERMPIFETRDYVRRVLDSYSVYAVLHGLATAPRLPTGAADAMADL